MAGRVEKPSRRHKSPISPKKLPLSALSSLVPSTSLPSSVNLAEASSNLTAVVAPSTPVSSVRDFFTRYIMGAQQAKKPAAPVVIVPAPVEAALEPAVDDHVPGSFTSSTPATLSSLPIPPKSIIHPPTPPRPRSTTATAPHVPKPSALPPSSRPSSRTGTTVASSSSSSRRPLQQTAIRSSNLPPALPLGPPTIIPSKKDKTTIKSRTVSNPNPINPSSSTRTLASSTSTRRLSSSSNLSNSTFRSTLSLSSSTSHPTLPKPFNLHTTTTRPIALPSPVPLPHEPGFIPSFEHSHALEAKRAALRLARTEALRKEEMERKKKQAELEQVGGGLFGGLEKRMMERGRWEEECRIKEGVFGSLFLGIEQERERLKIIEERKATVIKANPVPAMYRR
ncbi:hypothetical protein BDY24DRAFT_388988 [Mrakia frigida]|uniref:uncharacterized protein n=1 Tax=Mrakia frigida TaxID=29902 RepID=UPI003FCC1CE9